MTDRTAAQQLEALRAETARGEQIEQELRKRWQANERLLRKLLDLQDEERKLLAYAIHDGFVQDVVGAQWLLAAARHRLESQHDASLDELCAVETLLARAINQGRRMISQLRPLVIDEQGIVEALNYLASEEKDKGQLQIRFVHQVLFDRLPPLLESVVFRIVQEAVNNVKQHSQTNQLDIRLTQQDKVIWLDIQDQGIGFDPARVPEDRFGLSGIEKRAELFGGQAIIESAPGQGTRISVQLPITYNEGVSNRPS